MRHWIYGENLENVTNIGLFLAYLEILSDLIKKSIRKNKVGNKGRQSDVVD